MGETTGGKACWNYNLGNVKCADPKTLLHQYFSATWEYWPADMVKSRIASDPNSRYATPAEIKAKVGTEFWGKKVIFFKPPDIICCFLAHRSLEDGVSGWTDFTSGKPKNILNFWVESTKAIMRCSPTCCTKITITAKMKQSTPQVLKGKKNI